MPGARAILEQTVRRVLQWFQQELMTIWTMMLMIEMERSGWTPEVESTEHDQLNAR